MPPASIDQGIRNRHVSNSTQRPPVPPKPGRTLPSLPAKQLSKPLPSIPHPREKGNSRNDKSIEKPLPSPPNSLSLKSTSIWIAGLCLWFVAIVVLLPVITEKDAMPGFNQWLRKLLP
jgi:hypothetical protein